MIETSSAPGNIWNRSSNSTNDPHRCGHATSKPIFAYGPMVIQTPLPYKEKASSFGIVFQDSPATNSSNQPTHKPTKRGHLETFTGTTRLQRIDSTIAPTNLCGSSPTELDAFLHPPPPSPPPPSPLPRGQNPHRMTKCFTPKV